MLMLLGMPGNGSAGVTYEMKNVPVLAPWLAQLGRRFEVVRPDHCVFSSAAEALLLLDALRAALV